MQKSGRLKPVPKENSLKSLATESSVIMKSRSTVHYNKVSQCSQGAFKYHALEGGGGGGLGLCLCEMGVADAFLK